MKCLLISLGAVVLVGDGAGAQWTSLVNRDQDGQVIDGDPENWSLSRDGRFVAFDEREPLVPEDTNDARDVYLHDRVLQSSRIVSLAHDGALGNDFSGEAQLAAGGRFVVFASRADNLVPGDTNGWKDIFLRDLELQTTVRLSVGAGGVEANQSSSDPAISADGRFVVFESRASNLVPGDGDNRRDLYLLDRESSVLELVSQSTAGVVGDRDSRSASLSDDGRFIVFESEATNLESPDLNGRHDIFLRDRASGTTTLVSRATSGDAGNDASRFPRLSADGEALVFSSGASDLVASDGNGVWDVFLHELAGGLEIVSRADDGTPANANSLSGDVQGRFVSFQSDADNLVPGDSNGASDSFVWDRVTQSVRRISLHSNGDQGNLSSGPPLISDDGRHFAFYSYASTLVDDDDNDWFDLFVHSDWLHLTANAEHRAAGELLELSTWRGAPGTPTFLFVVGVNGAPFSIPLLPGSLDGFGNFQFSTSVPSGLAGLSVQLKAFGFAPPGSLEATQDLNLWFE